MIPRFSRPLNFPPHLCQHCGDRHGPPLPPPAVPVLLSAKQQATAALAASSPCSNHLPSSARIRLPQGAAQRLLCAGALLVSASAWQERLIAAFRRGQQHAGMRSLHSALCYPQSAPRSHVAAPTPPLTPRWPHRLLLHCDGLSCASQPRSKAMAQYCPIFSASAALRCSRHRGARAAARQF